MEINGIQCGKTGLPHTDSTGRGTVIVKAASVALDIRVPFPPEVFSPNKLERLQQWRHHTPASPHLMALLVLIHPRPNIGTNWPDPSCWQCLINVTPPILRSDNYLTIEKLSGVDWTSPEFLRKPTRVSPTGGKTNFRCRASMYKPPSHCPWLKLKGSTVRPACWPWWIPWQQRLCQTCRLFHGHTTCFTCKTLK